MKIEAFNQNKKAYLSYNNFRKHIFSELNPRDSEIILYMLPWMLSINDPAVPGFIPDLKTPIPVYGIDTDEKILKREATFKKVLNIGKPGSLLGVTPGRVEIQGLYTIGSIGTISQTPNSDCDIWVCIDKKDFTGRIFRHFHQKLNLIKDWLDAKLKMPVYFFICDTADIRVSDFGSVDHESAGSAQKNTLKEEFYRTTILIAGKIPLWWLCFSKDEHIDYAEFLSAYNRGVFADSDCLDLGAIDAVPSDEYFGAALWNFNKALTHPLKSIIKMLLLEMLLASPKHDLLCHQFRNFILGQDTDIHLIDPSMFTMEATLKHNRARETDTFDFIKKCFYLRYEIKLRQKMTIKEILARSIFERYPISGDGIHSLDHFSSWPLHEQIRFGTEVFDLLANVYKNISMMHHGTASSISQQDMQVIGRKLAVCLEKKQGKIPVFHKPVKNPNAAGITFALDSHKLWRIDADGSTIAAGPDIVYCLAYSIWNDVYEPNLVKMAPNPTSVTLQELNNLGSRIRGMFGISNVADIDFDHFSEPEKVTDILIIVNFTGQSQSKDIHDFCMIYKNHWGELFFQRFHSPGQFREFIHQDASKFNRADIHYYIQRNAQYYEKIIERTKQLVSRIFSTGSGLPEPGQATRIQEDDS